MLEAALTVTRPTSTSPPAYPSTSNPIGRLAVLSLVTSLSVENTVKRIPEKRNTSEEIPVSSFALAGRRYTIICGTKKPAPITSEPTPRVAKLTECELTKPRAKKYDMTIAAKKGKYEYE